MEKYTFFNDVDDDRIYFAEDFARHLATFFTNGIFNNGCKVIGENDDMSVNINIGSANINGYRYDNDDIKKINVDNADGVLNRIDNVVIRWDLTNRIITTQVIKGAFAEKPIPPNIERTSTIYDLRIAKISIPAGTTKITQDLITDTRFNSSDCGNVTQAVLSLNTEDIFNQYQTMFDTWFTEIKDKLSTDQAGNLQNEINEIRESLGLYTDTYNTSSIYSKGDLVIYDHKIYTCLENNITGNWDNSKWSLSPVVNPNDISVILPSTVLEEWEETE